MGVVVKEGEAVAFAGKLVVGKHGIAQTAGLAGNGQRAVAQRNHLRQPAGFKRGGHQEHIRARVDAVRQGEVHLKARRQAAGPLAFRPGEHVRIPRVALAQHRQLHAQLHDLRQHAVDKIQALLAGQARHHADKRRIRRRGKAQLALQRGLAGGLAFQVVGRVGAGNHGVVGRVVFLHVNAVEHAHQLPVPGAQEAVQAFAVVGGGDFLGIARADRGNLVGIHHAGFEEVGHAVAFQLVGGKEAVAQAQAVLYFLDAEDALVLQVVDGHDAAHPAVEGQMGVLNFVQRGNHAALPVMAVQDIGLKAYQRQRVEHRAAEKPVSLILVPAHPIDVRAVEIVAVVHEIPGQSFVFQSLNAAILPAPSQLHLKINHMLHLAFELLRDFAIQGQNHAHIHAPGLEHRRQRAHHVRQAARLDEGNAFGRGKEHFDHRSTSF